MPEMMQAVEISEPGGPDVLRLVERPVPSPGTEQILITVDHAGVNRPDALQRAGNYAPPRGASDLPGLEASGTISAVGTGVTRWSVGDKVCALLPGGGYAEHVVAHQDHALPIPSDLTMAQASALPETFFTVWSNVFMRAGLQAGEKFLVHGGSSGIGTTAIQLARIMGARVFTTAGSAEKCAACLTLGAEQAINYREADFVAAMQAAGGADVILDMVGGDYLPRNIKALADDGRLQQIAFLQGPEVEMNFAQVMMRRLTISGSTLRPQSDGTKAVIAAELRARVWPMLDAGRIAPVMDQVFDLKDAAKAHARMETSGHIGKIVLKVS